MDQIERRAFMKGAGSGVLAFTVGGVEVLLTPGAARTQGVPFRLLNANEGETSRRWARRWCPARARPALRISSTTRSRVPAEEALLQARIFNVRPPFANFYRAAHRRGRPRQREVNNGRKFCGAVDDRTARLRQQYAPEQDRRLDRARAERLSISLLRSDAVDVVYGTMEGYAALGIPYMPTSRQRRGGDMANEKVDVVIVGAGASGSVMQRAGQGRQEGGRRWSRDRTGRSPISSAPISGDGG